MKGKKSISLIIAVVLLVFLVSSAVAYSDSVTVTIPNSSTDAWSGTNIIRWTNVSSNSSNETGFNVAYSSNYNTSYIALVTTLPKTSQSYTWNTENMTDGIHFRIRVTKTSSNATIANIHGYSDEFTIDNTPGSHYYEEPSPTPTPIIATPSTMIESLKSPLGIILVVAVLALGYLLWKKK